jgi:hypothetical protein
MNPARRMLPIAPTFRPGPNIRQSNRRDGWFSCTVGKIARLVVCSRKIAGWTALKTVALAIIPKAQSLDVAGPLDGLDAVLSEFERRCVLGVRPSSVGAIKAIRQVVTQESLDAGDTTSVPRSAAATSAFRPPETPS